MRYNLNRHIRSVHDGKETYKSKQTEMKKSDKLTKQFDCHKCDKNFSTICDLKQHISSFHEGRRFKCDVCTKQFTARNGLAGHVARFHGERKIFNCQYCDSNFSTNVVLRNHIARIHEGKIKGET